MDCIKNIEAKIINALNENIKNMQINNDTQQLIIEQISNQITCIVAKYSRDTIIGFNISVVKENNVLICYVTDEKENTIIDILCTLEKERNDSAIISNIFCSINRNLF